MSIIIIIICERLQGVRGGRPSPRCQCSFGALVSNYTVSEIRCVLRSFLCNISLLKRPIPFTFSPLADSSSLVNDVRQELSTFQPSGNFRPLQWQSYKLRFFTCRSIKSNFSHHAINGINVHCWTVDLSCLFPLRNGRIWMNPCQLHLIQWYYTLVTRCNAVVQNIYNVLFTPKKTEHDVKIVKIVNVFKKIRTIAILMRKDVQNPGKLVWRCYD